jgi:hypothetical protein
MLWLLQLSFSQLRSQCPSRSYSMRPRQASVENCFANAGIRDDPVYNALGPFLPMLPAFLEGVTLAVAREYPREQSFQKLTDIVDPWGRKVDVLYPLIDKLAEHVDAADDTGTGESFLLHKHISGTSKLM